MKLWWLTELWCSVAELILGFRLERSFPGTPRLLETSGIFQQLPQAGSHPKGQLLLFPELGPCRKFGLWWPPSHSLPLALSSSPK